MPPTRPSENASDRGDPPLTSLQIQRAAGGDVESLEWVVARFSPLLLAQARYRMGGVLRASAEPEEIVNEVWAVALPRLEGLAEDAERRSPVLMKFLSTTLLHHVNNLLRRHFVRRSTGPEHDGHSDPAISELAEEQTGILSRAVRGELRGLVTDALERLPERDREILILRGFEQLPNQEVAATLGLPPNTVAVAYRRALQKLRDRLPDSVFAEMSE